ncbi:hypothetical protein BGW80DRAFT_396432 [Lactifluus volemus]|nr:hypothetical protein BGW80DRAFT_396432 [Lactifluus volemus]
MRGQEEGLLSAKCQRTGPPSFVLGQGCAEMGGTAWSTIAVRVLHSIPMEITKAMKLVGNRRAIKGGNCWRATWGNGGARSNARRRGRALKLQLPHTRGYSMCLCRSGCRVGWGSWSSCRSHRRLPLARSIVSPQDPQVFPFATRETMSSVNANSSSRHHASNPARLSWLKLPDLREVAGSSYKRRNAQVDISGTGVALKSGKRGQIWEVEVRKEGLETHMARAPTGLLYFTPVGHIRTMALRRPCMAYLTCRTGTLITP